jgi:arginyl-tRNA synthetase
VLEHLKAVVLSAFPEFAGQQMPGFRRPPDQKLGDYAMNCGPLAKPLQRPIAEIASTISAAVSACPEVASVSVTGTFVNIRLKPEVLFAKAVQVAAGRNAWLPGGQRVMVEFLSPNTNKPLHLGHLRNGTLGSSLANILEAVGHQVVRANLINDRGVHICKSMIAWQRFAGGLTPESAGEKGDHFVGKLYVRFCQEALTQPELEQEAQNMLRRWEKGDPEIRALWSTMNQWVYDGFAQTNTRFGFRFDKEYHESDLYLLGRDIVMQGLDRGVFVRLEDGRIAFPLDPQEFGTTKGGEQRYSTFLRDDGTSVYITQDLGTAVMKVGDFGIDRSIYVVADEQRNHFQVLFAALRALGYPWAPMLYHRSYAMVELPEGRMKSREGTVVDADNLADEMAEAAAAAVRERHAGKLVSEEEVAFRAERIAAAAIKFYLIRFDANTTVRFNPKESLSFEGDTGPCCLYAFARAQSILSRARQQQMAFAETFANLGEPEERALALDIAELPAAIQQAAKSCDPSIVANQALRLSRSLNRFYQKLPVLTADKPTAQQRLALVRASAEALRWALSLLGIETLDAM